MVEFRSLSFTLALVAVLGCSGDDGAADSTISAGTTTGTTTLTGTSTDTTTTTETATETSMGTGTGGDCAPGETLCGVGCFDLDTHNNHCGNCGFACAPGMVCEDGLCACRQSPCGGPCNAGESMCGDQCANLDTNPEHCGECDNACTEVQTCNEGGCECAASLMDCDGACVDTDSNPAHCGGCGTDCGADVCSNGTCQAMCDADVPDECDGACVDTNTDQLHCGDCDKPCDVDKVCAAGKCKDFSVAPCGECPCEACEKACCYSEFFDENLCVDENSCE